MRKTIVLAAAVLLGTFGFSGAQTRPVAGAGGSMNGQLSAAGGMLAKGESDRVVKDIQGSLNRYNSTDLPTAMFLLGKARAAMASSATDAKEKTKLNQLAALDFMKVITYFPYATEAPAAGLEAGRAMIAAGDKTAAKAVLGMTLSRYGDSDLAPEMKKALEKL